MGRGELDIVPYSTILDSIQRTGHVPQATYVVPVAIRVDVQYVMGCFCLGRFSAFYDQERSRTKVYFFSANSWVLPDEAYICHTQTI